MVRNNLGGARRREEVEEVLPRILLPHGLSEGRCWLELVGPLDPLAREGARYVHPPSEGFGFYGLWLGVWGLGFRVWGLGLRV